MRPIPGGPAFDEARHYAAVAHRARPIEALDVHREGFQSGAGAKIPSPPGLLPGDACATYTQERHDNALRAYGGYCWVTDTDTVVSRLNAIGKEATGGASERFRGSVNSNINSAS